MTSLHMVGHMVTVAVIATLVKQLMQLKFNLHDLKVELCDQETDATEFKNNFCERGTKHGAEENGARASESETEVKTKRKSRTNEAVGTKNTDKSNDEDTERDSEQNKHETSLDMDFMADQQMQKIDYTISEPQLKRPDKNIIKAKHDVETQGEKQVDWYSEEKHHIPFESSVWCHEPKNGFCHFKNLCYNTVEDDLFIMAGNESLFENVIFSDGSILIELSSLQNHNIHQKYVGSISIRKSGNLNITWIKNTSILFNRFKPDNIMHVLHDDLLPMFHSLRLISSNMGRSLDQKTEKIGIQIIYFDGLDSVEFAEFYQLFSAYPVVLKENLISKGSIICFTDAYTGVSKSTVWYDYGFHKPQGPITDFRVTSSVIHSLTNYVLQHLEPAGSAQPSASEYFVLFTRKQNRKIINEVELTLEIVQNLGIKVLNVNFEMFEFSKIIHLVHNSKGLLGMHGSLLSLAMFLKPGSVLVEFFPFAVNPDHYTPFKTLASVKGIGIAYRSWRNYNPEHSIGYPDRDLDEGGLGDLSQEERTEIMQQTEVPQHLCCTDPSWLYHIYQDTIVDIAEVTSLIKSSLDESGKYFDQSVSNFHPTQVKNVSCVIFSEGNTVWKLKISWNIPWIYEFLDKMNIQYEILIQDIADRSAVMSYVTGTIPFTVDLDRKSSYFVWVKCIKDKTINGPFSDSTACIFK